MVESWRQRTVDVNCILTCKRGLIKQKSDTAVEAVRDHSIHVQKQESLLH